MEKLFLYNTLTRKKEEFEPLHTPGPLEEGKGEVGMYTCGPTVYQYAHIGNLRSYIFEDILKRVLLYNDYQVKHVMNITDVGHLTGDRDMGEDKLEQSAKQQGKSASQLALFYTKAFLTDMKRLNLVEPDIWCRATDHIAEQIDLIRKLENNDYTYKTSDGIYFDTSRFKNYTKLSHQNLEALQEGARVEKNPEKRNPADFALWKFSPKDVKRQQEWESPWGVGFPGWHLECSAMSMKYLGEQFDIHCGGVDHINVHHTNEIAQSEAVTGKSPWVKYWLHGEFLVLPARTDKDKSRMGKSEGNIIILDDLVKKGFNPLAYRFMALMTHYRKQLQFSWDGLKSAQEGLNHLYNQIRDITPTPNPSPAPVVAATTRGAGAGEGSLKVGDNKVNQKYKEKFVKAINNNLNIPKALAVTQEMLKSKLANQEKLATILDFDLVLGLDLDKVGQTKELPSDVKELVKARERARAAKNFKESDKLREQIEEFGYTVEDTDQGTRVFKK